ncbi:MAG: thiamine-phosphate kinase [Prochlorococcaceae cyanobacterium]
MSSSPGQLGAGETLAELGEWGLIQRLAAFAAPGQFNDDGALLQLPRQAGRDSRLVISSDVLVDGVHFSDATTGAADVGWRAAAANLSDLAAMGCHSALGVTVALVAPSQTPWRWVEGVYTGLSAALADAGGELLGGDCSGGSQRLLAITAIGLVGAAAPIQRCQGRPGDLLVSSGDHGLSRLGLALLRGELSSAELAALPEQLGHRAISCHRRPRARFDAVRALQQSQQQQPWRVAGTDSSDGLLAALGFLAAASGCTAVLERAALPLDPAMASLPQAEGWCLSGGEDFELVLALAPTWAHSLCQTLPGSRLLGRLEQGAPQVLWAEDRQPVTSPQPGFDHFR